MQESGARSVWVVRCEGNDRGIGGEHGGMMATKKRTAESD
jgi:hypothetical protein